MLVLLPIPGETLVVKFCCSYTIDTKVTEGNYIVCTPGARKDKLMCHVNTLNGYYERDDEKQNVRSQILLLMVHVTTVKTLAMAFVITSAL